MSLFKTPTFQELNLLSEKHGLHLNTKEIEACSEFFKEGIEPFQSIFEVPEFLPPVKYSRGSFYHPKKSENDLNAWYYKTSIKGASSGKLVGKKVGIKDTVFVAGIPMMNGSRVLEGFIPEYDATIVTRLLDEGAEIVGKTTCEDFSSSSESYFTTYGPVKNPWNVKHSSGGSSSGSAVLLATREVDFAIGGDQGGSIRVPSSYCGVVGLKPTYGLVPYTGVCSIDSTIDHVGPMARNVKDCALMLEVIAGHDEMRDLRQPTFSFDVPQYSQEIEIPAIDLRIGVLKDGFEGCKPDVLEVCYKAVDIIKDSKRFCDVKEISAPHHAQGISVWKATTGGAESSSLADHVLRGMKSSAPALAQTMKMNLMFTAYMKDKYGPAPYVRAQNLNLRNRKLYDQLFEEVDILLMPTVPHTAPEIPTPQVPIHVQIQSMFRSVKNTAPFNSSHHPAITINAGFSEESGLPVGLMLVARRWKDADLLKAAHVIEQTLSLLIVDLSLVSN